MTANPLSSRVSPLWGALQAAWLGALPPVSAAWHDGLLPDLRRGRIEVQEAFVAHFWPQIVEESRRYGRAGGDRDDLMGEGALALWESVFGYRPTRHRTTFSDYVHNAVHQRIRRAYRKQLHQDQPVDERILERTGTPDSDLAAAEWALDIARAVETLSPDERKALKWRPTPAMSPSDYEKHRKRLTRARHRLKAALHHEPGFEGSSR